MRASSDEFASQKAVMDDQDLLRRIKLPPDIKTHLLRVKESQDRSEEIIMGSLVGLSIVVIVQLLALQKLDKRLTVSLYCFVMSIPLLTTELLCTYAELRYRLV